MRRESKFQADLRHELEEEVFPGCITIKTNANDIQGFPDLIVLIGSNWVSLECKRSLDEPYQPNQEYYLERLGEMSFAAMICPENKEEVLDEIQRSLGFKRPTRFPKR